MSETTDPDERAGASAHPDDDALHSVRQPADPVAVAAVTCGLIGIVVLGLPLAVITAVLASWAGQRARAVGRSLDNSLIALGLAVLDGVVWLVLHFVFDLSFVAG